VHHILKNLCLAKRLEPLRKLRPLISGSKTEFFNAETRGHRDAKKPQSELGRACWIKNQLKKWGFSASLCLRVSALKKLRLKERVYLGVRNSCCAIGKTSAYSTS
jgi:hypothetical protein